MFILNIGEKEERKKNEKTRNTESRILNLLGHKSHNNIHIMHSFMQSTLKICECIHFWLGCSTLTWMRGQQFLDVWERTEQDDVRLCEVTRERQKQGDSDGQTEKLGAPLTRNCSDSDKVNIFADITDHQLHHFNSECFDGPGNLYLSEPTRVLLLPGRQGEPCCTAKRRSQSRFKLSPRKVISLHWSSSFNL